MLLEGSIITYNLAEGVISIVAGVIAGSVVLVGFGLDSAIEVTAALVVVYHLSRSREDEQPSWEHNVARFVGVTLLALAVYVTGRAVFNLVTASRPEESYIGIAVTMASVIVMPVVSRLQLRYAHRIKSAALAADSRETLACTYLSIAALLGLGANALFGWWWADPIAGIVVAALVAREGWEVFSNAELICVDD
jgi:cation diffusion facilitator family transporter